MNEKEKNINSQLDDVSGGNRGGAGDKRYFAEHPERLEGQLRKLQTAAANASTPGERDRYQEQYDKLYKLGKSLGII